MLQHDRLFRDRQDFEATLRAAAEQLELPPIAVEKDYWLTQALRQMTLAHPNDFIFKGGTSLSKGYGLIRRFSEDIDILVIPGNRGLSARDTLMKSLANEAARGTGGEAKAHSESQKGVHRTRLVTYPSSFPEVPFVRKEVLLEMGIRGGDQPASQIEIHTLVGARLTTVGQDVSEFSDLASFSVVVLHPVRTLLEKLSLVHAEAAALSCGDQDEASQRNSRHFYDIYHLLNHEPTRTLLRNQQIVQDICNDIDRINREFYSTEGQARPSQGFATSPAFDTTSKASSMQRAVYETTVPDLLFSEEELPDWAALCERVQSTAHVL